MPRSLRWVGVATAVVVHPSLWPTALRQAPVVRHPAWMRFRFETQYGDAGHAPVPSDVLEWLRWCKAWRRCTA
jgi:hypothetical protein